MQKEALWLRKVILKTNQSFGAKYTFFFTSRLLHSGPKCYRKLTKILYLFRAAEATYFPIRGWFTVNVNYFSNNVLFFKNFNIKLFLDAKQTPGHF